MPLNFGLGPKSNMAAMAAILKKKLQKIFSLTIFFGGGGAGGGGWKSLKTCINAKKKNFSKFFFWGERGLEITLTLGNPRGHM